jgi:hypothetical protein
MHFPQTQGCSPRWHLGMLQGKNENDITILAPRERERGELDADCVSQSCRDLVEWVEMPSTEREGMRDHEMSGGRLVERLGLSLGEARDWTLDQGNMGQHCVMRAGRNARGVGRSRSRQAFHFFTVDLFLCSVGHFYRFVE